MMRIPTAGRLARHGVLAVGTLWLAATLAVSAWAASANETTPPAATETTKAGSVVDLPADEAGYGNAQTCISMSAIRSHTILDGGHLVFHLPRGRYVLSQLQPRCSSMRRNNVIQLNPTSTARLCALDKVEVLGSVLGAGALQVIDTCVLGKFEEISRDQLLALKAELQGRR